MNPFGCKSRFAFGVMMATLSLLVLPVSSRAANVQVVCPGGGPGVYASISAALSALDPHGPNSITVSGTCVENIFIFQFERLSIQSAPGQSAVISAADPSGIVLQTFQSTGILLSGLVFQGGLTGVLLNQGSNVTMVNCTMQQNSGDGLDMQMASTLVMKNSTMQDNQGSGLSVNAGSNATMATQPNERIRVLRNGGDGIDVDGSYFQVNFGSLDVENNAGAAIFQAGGRLVIFDDGVNGGNLFQGNGEGIDIFNAGSAQFFGRNVVRNNGDVGLQVLGSSVSFNGGGTLPDGTVRASVFEGHATLGVNIVRMGEVTFNGPHTITNNGNLTADSTIRGGIRVNRSSLTLNRGVQVSGNVGPGIRAEQNSGFFSTGDATIVNNTEAGMLVTLQSEAAFAVTPVISGNGVASISCDTTSLISGQLAGIANISCSQIARTLGPARPGKIRP